MAQPILDRHPRLSSALRGLTNSWVNSARNHAPVVARAAASVAVAHSVRTLASVEALFNASDHNGLFFNASDHHGMFFSWENFAEFEGTSITQEITEELPDDVHSGALYAVLGLSLVVLFGDVAFGYKCRETKMKRAANFSELSERLSELDAKLAQEEVAAATPVSLARSLSASSTPRARQWRRFCATPINEQTRPCRRAPGSQRRSRPRKWLRSGKTSSAPSTAS